jgi:hypothetical protein
MTTFTRTRARRADRRLPGRHGGRRIRWAALIAVLTGVATAWSVTAAWSATGDATAGTSHTSTAAAPTITWVIEAHAITLLQQAGASQSLLQKAFGNTHSYEPGVSSGSTPLGVPTASYDSYTAIKQAFASNALPGRFRAVLLDLEHWKFTPVNEQDNPAKYEKLAAKLVHSHKVDGHPMLLITTPAVDLVLAHCSCSTGNSMRQHYLSADIAGGAARYADIIDIQAQSVERSVRDFTTFVSKAAKQARAANKKVVVIAGLSTDNGSQEVYAYQLLDAYKAVRKIVAGYWLNIPGPGPFCPKCGGPFPAPAVTFLKDIYG